jgi:hypothetical protein
LFLRLQHDCAVPSVFPTPSSLLPNRDLAYPPRVIIVAKDGTVKMPSYKLWVPVNVAAVPVEEVADDVGWAEASDSVTDRLWSPLTGMLSMWFGDQNWSVDKET